MYITDWHEDKISGHTICISIVPPEVCTYNCIYCNTVRKASPIIARREVYSRLDILSEIVESAKTFHPQRIVISDHGEPTLYHYLGWIIRQIRENCKTEVAVKTNGSLLFRKDVRQDLEESDIVTIKIDSLNYEHYLKINRPAGSIDFDLVKQGILDFAHGFNGKIYIEVTLIKGLNDNLDELLRLSKWLLSIHPEAIHLLTPNRADSNGRLMTVDPESISRAIEIFSNIASVVRVDDDYNFASGQ